MTADGCFSALSGAYRHFPDRTSLLAFRKERKAERARRELGKCMQMYAVLDCSRSFPIRCMFVPRTTVRVEQRRKEGN